MPAVSCLRWARTVADRRSFRLSPRSHTKPGCQFRPSATFSTLAMRATTAAPPASLAEHVPGFLWWIAHCNNGTAALANGALTPFVVEGATVGYMTPSFAQGLNRFPALFQLGGNRAGLAPALEAAPAAERTAAVGEAMQQLREQGVIGGWRDELYPVLTSFNQPPALLLERAAAPFWGIKAYGNSTFSLGHTSCGVAMHLSPASRTSCLLSREHHIYMGRSTYHSTIYNTILLYIIAALYIPVHGTHAHGLCCAVHLQVCTSTATSPCLMAARSCGWLVAAPPSPRGLADLTTWWPGASPLACAAATTWSKNAGRRPAFRLHWQLQLWRWGRSATLPCRRQG